MGDPVVPLPLSSDPLEKRILAVLLMPWEERSRVLATAKGLAPDWFFSPRHSAIYQAITDLVELGLEVAPWAVIERIRATTKRAPDLPGELYIIGLPDTAPCASDLPIHLATLDDYRRGREARVVLTEALDSLHPFGLNDQIEATTSALTDLHREEEARLSRPPEILTAVLKKIYAGASELTGLSTPWAALNDMFTTFTPGALTFIGGRPGMGKTALALGLADHVARVLKKGVAFFSLEMGAEQLMIRWLSMVSGVDGGKLRRGDIVGDTPQKLTQAITEISPANMRIFDSPNTNPASIRAQCLEMQREGELAMVVVDYIQLMASTNKEEHRRAEVDRISRDLKLLAKELEVPIVALSQLSRALEQRSDRRPRPSDLRETGNLEADADAILFVYRDSVYEEGADPGEAEIIIGKQRDGPLGTAHLRWRPSTTSFI